MNIKNISTVILFTFLFSVLTYDFTGLNNIKEGKVLITIHKSPKNSVDVNLDEGVGSDYEGVNGIETNIH